MMQIGEDAASCLLDRWNAVLIILSQINDERSHIMREARAMGIDVNWLKAGSIIMSDRRKGVKSSAVGSIYDRLVAFEKIAAPERKHTNIYFAVSPPAKILKVGISVNPESRLKNIEVPGMPLFLWATFRGTTFDETITHKALDNFRISGEWFHYNQESKEICKAIFRERGAYINEIPANIAPFSRVTRSVRNLSMGAIK